MDLIGHVITCAQAVRARGVVHPGIARVLPLRLDDDASYEAHLLNRAADKPSLDELARAVAELRRALISHTRDGHGGEVVLGAAVDAAVAQNNLFSGDGEVPLSVRPSARGGVRCWRDGGWLCCSIRVLCPDGPRVMTACVPLAEAVAEVACYAQEGGGGSEGDLDGLSQVALGLGGGDLLERLSEAALVKVHHFGPVAAVGTLRAGGQVDWR